MSAKVLARVKTWIASSELSVGARLPPERDLCKSLGVSRTELRKAFLVLESNGNLTREVGRGTYLTRKPEQRKADNSERTISDLAETTGPVEAMMARLALEPELARMAALHASPRQLRRIRELASKMRNSTSWRAYEELDSEFHDIIARASGNSLLHELHKILNGVRFVVVWRRLDMPETAPNADYHSFSEHDDIIEALESRSGKAASAAMRTHLESTLSTMTVNH